MSDVFISYAHEDTGFVERLRDALSARGREVWVDTSGIEPADRWRTSAQDAIDRSDAFVFVISADSLRSQPCRGELEHAFSLNKRVIPVCVDDAAADMDKPDALGELSWIMMRSVDSFDAGVDRLIHALDTDLEVVREHTRILVRAKAWELAGRRTSPLLRGEELRMAEQWVARAAAAGSPPTELHQAFIAASRRASTRRLRLIAGVAVGVAVLAVVLSIYALIQRSTAIQEAKVASSRQLAAVAQTVLPTNLDVALLLAVRAYRTDPNPQTRAALLQADLYSPYLARFVSIGTTVARVAGSADGRTLVAALSDGRVMRAPASGGPPVAVASLSGPATSLAVSGDGHVIVAGDGSRAILWRAGTGASSLSCPAPQKPFAAGVSPSGRTLAVFCNPQGTVELLDGSSGQLSGSHPTSFSGSSGANVVVFPSESEVLLWDSRTGPWQLRGLASWSLLSSSSGSFGAHQGTAGYSGDGGYVTVTNGDPNVPVWPTSIPTSFDPATAPFTAQVPINATGSLTLSPRGGELATADNALIYVARVLGVKTQHGTPIELTGVGHVNADALRFYGDDNHLLSASGGQLALWNLNQVDRLARTQALSIPSPCGGCSGASAVVSPDGRRLAAVASAGDAAVIDSLTGAGRPTVLTARGYGAFGPPVWDGQTLLLPRIGPAGTSSPPAGVRILPAVNGDQQVVAAALELDGRTLTVVDQTGEIFSQDVSTGKIVHRIPGPPDLARSTIRVLLPQQAVADTADGAVALVDNGVVRITSVASGALLARLPGNNAAALALGGHRLLVQHSDGSLEVWRTGTWTSERVLAGDQSYGYQGLIGPVEDPAGNIVARQLTNEAVTLVDLNTGAILATLPPPAASTQALRLGVAFSPDGGTYVSVLQTVLGDQASITQRDLRPTTLVRAACAAAGRQLTPSDWRAYVGTTPPGDLACR